MSRRRKKSITPPHGASHKIAIRKAPLKVQTFSKTLSDSSGNALVTLWRTNGEFRDVVTSNKKSFNSFVSALQSKRRRRRGLVAVLETIKSPKTMQAGEWLLDSLINSRVLT